MRVLGLLIGLTALTAASRDADAACDPATEVDHNGGCYYLDGSGGKCDVGYMLASEKVLDNIATQFQGKTYKHAVSDNCCVQNADVVQNWGFQTACNASGPFGAGDPAKGGSSCINVMNMYPGQLTLCVGNNGPFTANPTKIAFADTSTGSTSPATTLVFTNISSGAATATAITLTGAQAAEFGLSSVPSLPITVAPGGTFSLGVTFSPAQMGARAATLKVTVQGQTSTGDVNLTGNGIGPKLVLSPNPFKIGSTGVGVPVMKDLTVENQGGKVSVLSASITQGGADFSIVGAVGFPVLLPTSAQFNLTLRFNPTVTGLRNGELTLTTDDVNASTVRLPLVGTSGPAMITLDSGSIAFAAVNVGATSAPTTITISNTGFSDLSVTDIALGGALPGDYQLDKMAFPGVLAPGASGKINVRFAPTAAGQRAASVIVSSTDPGAPTRTVALFGTGTLATMSLGPASLAFGTVKAGKPSAAQMVTITNGGTGTLKVMAYSFGGGGMSSYTLAGAMPPVSVAGGGSTTIGVICNPMMVGALGATFTVTADIGSQSIPLTCTGAAPQITLAPGSLDFGGAQLNTATTPKTVTVSNIGNVDLSISSLTMAGAQSADFKLMNAPTLPLVLAPTQSTTLQVVFTPAAQGARAAELDIGSDDLQLPLARVTLAGNGVMLGLAASPTLIDFGIVTLGAMAGPKAALLTNTGTADLTITALTIGGPGSGRFIVQETAPLQIAVGATQMVRVSYAPVLAGVDNATLNLTVTGLGNQPIGLRGTGVNPTVSVTPLTLDFGPVYVGKSSLARTVTIKNGQTAPVSISGVTSSNPSYLVDTAATLKTLGPMMSTTFTVTFEPAAAGAQTAKIAVQLGGVTVAEVSTAGTGVAEQMAGGCSCALGGRSTPPFGAGLALLGAGVALVLYRRSRRRADLLEGATVSR